MLPLPPFPSICHLQTLELALGIFWYTAFNKYVYIYVCIQNQQSLILWFCLGCYSLKSSSLFHFIWNLYWFEWLAERFPIICCTDSISVGSFQGLIKRRIHWPNKFEKHRFKKNHLVSLLQNLSEWSQFIAVWFERAKH